ncbi:1-acyl-sn-glycerol-3-phosphate acyltransferase [Myxococcota bacterium]|nr:1-acyl-sn-glycerol-3-phosphate acyltransferase [Myxococcota bacterium]
MTTASADEGEAPRPSERDDRPELFSAAADKLGWLERTNIKLVQTTFENPALDRVMTALQRWIGAGWIDVCTRNIRHVHGFERLPPDDPSRSFILVSNHRSFFDMFVINAVLYKKGWRHRLLFPVRSSFFYDHPLGFLVNGVMSFWSMYPPVFRDRKKMVLNHTAWSELAFAMRRGRSTGIHPEGTRKKDDDPYTFLPAQSGVGRLIHRARVPVLPVFVNGLGNDLVKQVAGNFTRKGRKIVVVFGGPIDFGAMLDEPATGRLYKQIADHTLTVIGALGEEERAIRATLEGAPPALPPGAAPPAETAG